MNNKTKTFSIPFEKFFFILPLIIFPSILHILFSNLGFNPTDEGFILAYSRRILEGQIPHLDFISIRPIGSPLFHIPFVLYGGEYTFLLSRLFSWFQFACISWIWVLIISSLLKLRLNIVERVCYFIITFAFTNHHFPPMALHTIDSLFFGSLGLILCVKESQKCKFIGYILLGLTYICRQNFILVGPLTLLILGDFKQWRFWFATALAGIAYFSYLLFTHAVPDAIIQIGSQTNFWSPGIKSYVTHRLMPWGIILGFLIMYLTGEKIKIHSRGRGTNAYRWLSFIITFSILFTMAIYLNTYRNFYYWKYITFGLFGCALGAVGYLIMDKTQKTGRKQAGLLVLLMAWCASISIGYNTPALVSGSLALWLIACNHDSFSSINQNYWIKRLSFFLTLLITGVTIINYVEGRRSLIYREQPAHQLNQSLDDIFPGGKGLRTNPRTYQFLVDLNTAIKKTDGWDFAILPDLAGYWVKSPQKNPLPIVWAQGNELNNQTLIDRVTEELEKKRDKIIILIQKVRADSLAKEFIPLTDSRHYAVVSYVRTHFNKIDETEFFDLYQ